MTATQYLDYVYLVPSTEQPVLFKPLRQDPDDYLRQYSMEVRGWDFSKPSSNKDIVLGKIEMVHVLRASALNNGVALADVMREWRSPFATFAPQVFDEVTEDFREDFLDSMSLSPMNLDFIYVPVSSWVDSAWGPSVLHLIAQNFPLCSCLILGLEGAGAIQTVEVQGRGRRLEELGFEQYESSPYFFLDLSLQLPEIPAHLKPVSTPRTLVAA